MIVYNKKTILLKFLIFYFPLENELHDISLLTLKYNLFRSSRGHKQNELLKKKPIKIVLIMKRF